MAVLEKHKFKYMLIKEVLDKTLDILDKKNDCFIIIEHMITILVEQKHLSCH